MSESSATMNIKITGNSHDHLLALNAQALKIYYRRSTQSQLVILAVAIVTFIYGVTVAKGSLSIWNIYTFSGAVMGVLAIAGVSLSRHHRKKSSTDYRRAIEHKNQQGQWTLEISTDRIHYCDAELSAAYKWSCFETFTEYPEAVVIHSYGTATYGITVARQFVSQAEYKQFREFCNANLKSRNGAD